MDKNTLSNYGWIVICVLVLAVMIALATPFGTYIENGVRSTTAGLFDTSEKALNVVGMSAGDGNFEDGYQGGTSSEPETQIPEYNHDAPELHHSGTLPEGAEYNTSDITFEKDGKFEAGDNFPIMCQDYDYYTYGDYVYTYIASIDGWEVRCNDKSKTEYGPILESINGKPTKSMQDAFYMCFNLTSAPVIPLGITNLNQAFAMCSNLKTYAGSTDPDGDFSGYVIPKSVTEMDTTFTFCTSLTGWISIPCSLAIKNYTYTDCPATITYYHIDDCDGSCGK